MAGKFTFHDEFKAFKIARQKPELVLRYGNQVLPFPYKVKHKNSVYEETWEIVLPENLRLTGAGDHFEILLDGEVQFRFDFDLYKLEAGESITIEFPQNKFFTISLGKKMWEENIKMKYEKAS